MAICNGDNAVQTDEKIERILFEDRASAIRWQQAPDWAWKYMVEEVFGQTRAYWLSEDETQKLQTDVLFDVRTGERVVIPLDWK